MSAKRMDSPEVLHSPDESDKYCGICSSSPGCCKHCALLKGRQENFSAAGQAPQVSCASSNQAETVLLRKPPLVACPACVSGQ